MRTPLSGQPGVLRPDAEADISAIFAPRLYLVDTDPQTRAQLASCLREKGFDVVTATDMNATPPSADVLIVALDGLGPHANVPEWLAAKPATPLIVLDRPQVFPGRTAPLNFVPDARLSLPVPPRKLVATIRQALSLARIESADLHAAAARTYRFAGWVLDSEARQLTSRDGTTILLDPRECDVLKALLTFPRQVLTRPHLIAMVWGAGEAVENRTLDRPITRLRRHLGDDVRFPVVLKTVVGVGYRLDVDVEKTDKPRLRTPPWREAGSVAACSGFSQRVQPLFSLLRIQGSRPADQRLVHRGEAHEAEDVAFQCTHAVGAKYPAIERRRHPHGNDDARGAAGKAFLE